VFGDIISGVVAIFGLKVSQPTPTRVTQLRDP